MNWPEHIIDEIRQRADIVEVISEYVVLTKKGKNYLGLCPFHHEKTPSFTVTPDKQMFYCFGCQTGGNVFTFLTKRENLNFTEAVKLLADRTGVSLPEEEVSPLEQAKNKQRELIAQINKAAKDFYHNILLTAPLAQTARDYLKGRGIDHQTLDEFQLGFAPEGWSNLRDFLKGRGYSDQEMISAGVITPKDGGGGYDRFRNRIIFPIRNVRGQVIGFGGRVLDDALPKYLNSPETAFFNKGQNLYGLNLAYQEIRNKGEAMVVEGYMDVISAHKNGFSNAVASLGTALTREQGKLLLRYTHNVLLGYDSDLAGINATLKGSEILRDLGCRVRILSIPSGKDPDEYLRTHSPEEFTQVVSNSKGIVEYKLERLLREIPPSNIHSKVEIVNSLASDILKLESLVEREGYIRLIANTLGITEEIVLAEIKRISAKTAKIKGFSDNYRANSHTNSGNLPSEFENDGKTVSPPAKEGNDNSSKIFRAENLLLRLMLDEPKVISLLEEELGWEAFTDSIHSKVLGLIKEAWLKGNWNPSVLTVNNDEFLASYLAQLTLKELDVTNSLKAAEDCIKVIKQEQIQKKINTLKVQAGLMQKSGDIEGALKLLQEINILVRQSLSIAR